MVYGREITVYGREMLPTVESPERGPYICLALIIDISNCTKFYGLRSGDSTVGRSREHKICRLRDLMVGRFYVLANLRSGDSPDHRISRP